MMWGLLYKKKDDTTSSDFDVSRMITAIVTSSEIEYSDSAVTHLSLTATRRMPKQTPSSSATHLSLTATRRMPKQTPSSSATHLSLTATRKMNENKTKYIASRMITAIIHS